MTDDSAGECVTQLWDRETYLKAMRLADQGADHESMELRNHRQPVFLSPDLAIVVTEWRFKCMIETGWGDLLKQHLAA